MISDVLFCAQEYLGFLRSSMADRRCLRRIEILKNEGLGLFHPLWRAVVASGGSKSSHIKDLGFCKPLWRTVVASGGSKSSTIEGLGFLRASMADRRCLQRVEILTN